MFAACALSVSLNGCSGNRTQQPSDERRPAPAQSSGSPENTATSPPVTAETPNDNRKVIVAFGDSLTAGVVEKSYPQYLQEILDQRHLPFRVENQGVAGDTSSDGVARIDNVTAEHPLLVLLEFGGNDGLRGVPVETTKKNLDDMIATLKRSGIQIVLLGITLPPNYGVDYIKPFNAMYADLAAKYKITLLPFLLIDVYSHNNLMQPDGIHPNSAGNRVVAEDVFRTIEPLLKRLEHS
ncbi:MAG: arylesterase [Acidobacteriaceae bacterium]|nr:arylesterase [Acidobacteriaceae bacterium]